MFILYSASSGLEYWSVNNTLIYENFELHVFKNIKFLDKISNNWPNDLLGTNVYKAHVESMLIIIGDNVTMY